MTTEVKKYEKLDELDYYFERLKKFKPLSREEEYELSRKIQNGDEMALQKLVSANLTFVVSIAKKYRSSGVCFSDLISEGNIGLIKAARKFNPDKGVKFISYAIWWIKAAIQDCIDAYSKQEEFNANDQYVLNDKHDDEYEYNSNIINMEYAEEVQNIQSREASIEDLMKTLEKREIKILTLYFGLYGNKERTLDEIGQELHITSERVRQIKDKAIIKMKCNALMSDEFETFMELV